MARILIGDTPAARALVPDVDWETLGTDEIVIRTIGKDRRLAQLWP